MKKTILLMWWLGLTSIVNAQIITIKDSATGSPLSQVAIIKSNPNEFTSTNKIGEADISSYIGAAKIELILLGYERMVCSYDSLKSLHFQVLMKDLAFSSDEVVVSSSRWHQNVRDIPFKVTSISPREAKLAAPQTAADLLGSSGDVFIQKSQLGGGSPMIRGFSTNRLLYSVDGVRMNTAIFRSGNIQNVISLDPFAIAHTEILFGPGSVIYGSDAIGGVMSFQTLMPKLALHDDFEVSGTALSRVSTANQEKTGHFDLNLAWKKWAAVTSISSTQYGDQKMGSYGPEDYLRPFYVQRIGEVDVMVNNEDPKVQTPSGYNQINLMQKIRFKPSKKWDFELGMHYAESSEYARYDRHIQLKDGLPRYGEWNYGPQIWQMNNLNIVHQGNNKLYDQMNMRVAQQYFQESRISRNFNAVEREINLEEVYAYSGNIDFNKSLGKRNQLFYGAEYILNQVSSSGVLTDISTQVSTIGPARYPQATWTSIGAYINNQFYLNEKLLFQGGIRYSYFDVNATFDTSFYPIPFTETNTQNGALTGSAGMVYKANHKLVLSANLSTGFRAPNVDDIGKVFDSEPGAVVVPNSNLSAEYAYNADVNITKVFGSFLKVDLTGFYTYLTNAMVRRDYTLGGLDSIMYAGELSKVQAIQNAAFASVYGFQFSVELMLGSGFSLQSKINYQIGEEELDDGSVSPSRHAAPTFGLTRLNLKRGDLSLQIYSEYMAEKSYENLPISEQAKDYLYAKDSNGNPYAPAWYTLNFKAMYAFDDRFTINAGLENITDQRYRPFSSGITAAGRNFILGIKVTF
ncbi:TonB-dependent receptor [Putridiphycobacter roseus]|uniref:TonB-dependent receptor n=1 Tax=Putridiphycobacter roseus TaxID=2219161 RepID=A0A2W1NT23_9FLAO|nr:TonB-dependent receptor [Putridiphycobacter roseus]PZE17838.1 TonB-dependent receptor [Putridiphycobacter roseus]